MKKMMVFLISLLLIVGFSQVSRADILLNDNFNGENGGVGILNYTGFANWAVSDGTVDLIGNGYFDFLPGNGLYVDMDGSTGNAGIMTDSFTLLAGQTYTLQFDLAGNHRDGSNEQVIVQVALGTLLNETFSLIQNGPFTSFTRTFVPSASGTATLSFEGVGGDNIGMLLDNVKLESTSVPEPGILLLLGSGLLGVFGLRRRFQG